MTEQGTKEGPHVRIPWWLTVYVRLGHRHEREAAAELGETRTRYAEVTPRWFPRRRARGAERRAT
jgi:hypothetical protein